MKETRIAVVMNGGISLAVWMGGVTHELNRVRLARTDGATAPKDEKERKVHEAWGAILDHAGARVVVDTIAGTSAGGLNGTLLATAIAQGGDLAGLKETWLDQAALDPGKLLRANPENAPTLLDGDFFTREINRTLDRIGASTFPRQECTLLVTATSTGRSLATMIMEGDQEDRYRDSRRVFRFRRELKADESELVNDFIPPDADRNADTPSGPLARAARASASYPVAFAPVWEDEDLERHRTPGSPKVVRSPLMDGGVLDNAPFGPVIDALRQRPVGAAFERVLLYVVPSARTRMVPALDQDEVPDVGHVIGALIKTIREPDQRLDVELLRDSFRQMSFQRSSPHAVLASALAAPSSQQGDLEGAATALLDDYRAGRAEVFYRRLSAVGATAADLRRPLPAFVDLNVIPVLPSRLLPGTPWQWGPSAAARVLRWMGRALALISDDTASGGVKALFDAAFDQVQKSQRISRDFLSSLDKELETRVETGDDYASRLAAFVEIYVRMTEGNPLGTAVHGAAQAIAQYVERDVDHVLATVLHLEVLSSVFAWGGDESDVPAFKYLLSSPAARPLVDVPMVQKSPGQPGYDDEIDAWATKKLYGERWGHFGAFATEEGRAHDWLWGRLDGASSLVAMLLGPDATASSPTKELVDALAGAILEAEGSSSEKVRTDAATVTALTDRKLIESIDEQRRELIFRTIPEVLGEISVIPAKAEGVAEGLFKGVEALLDLVELPGDVVQVSKKTASSVKSFLGRIWSRRPWNDDD